MEHNNSLRKRRKEIQDSNGFHLDQSFDKKRLNANIIEQPLPTLKLFVGLFFIRLVNALTIKTFFQADEFYQCLEPAYNLVFGSGYITWEWDEAIRSSIHPLLYALGYKIASYIPLGNGPIIVIPKVIGALIASIGEVYLYKFSKRFTKNEKLAKLTLILSLLNPFNWYIITRSFSNSFEMVLTTVALTYWPWDNLINYKDLSISCLIAFVSCIVRPTNGIIWLYLGFNFILRNYKLEKQPFKLIRLIFILAVELVLILLINTGLDYTFYGKVTFPLYNFVEFNVIRNLSMFYGVAPWHFYIFQGVPIILMTYLPWLLHSAIVLKKYKSLLGQIAIVMIGVFSLIDHKEIRFIYPLQPIFILMTAYSIYETNQKFQRVYKFLVPIIIILNMAIAIFFTRIHERGVIDIVQYLGTHPEIESFGFLTPCHSTPWQSHINNPDLVNKSWFLTCEPPLHLTSRNLEEIRSYRDESDQFYDNPTEYLRNHFLLFSESRNMDSKNWPSRLIIFQPLENFMNDFLRGSNYFECERFFNSYFHWDDRRKGDIIVYCQT
ncbi:GPI mannosyltransferase 3 [Debaryomyces fabryi]|uniref:Mannosyltransferase n=1 Tax=Debaryomyces fabryi TaxID=58627 RepID=A0A0V1PVT1_9ASCO|nr:GPI mannosyltransferase 3 [Debaryomyces fabryi]KSA00156.1 GPI mannosyltransferase 3 [Debaryomyces fabryi]